MSALDLSDPCWFPADYLANTDQFRMLRLSLDRVGNAAFLDQRLDTDGAAEVLVDAASTHADIPAHPPAYLFHTAFCGSTLLARALHAPPRVVALKEPLALLSLSAAAARHDPGVISERLATTLRLMARGWSADGMCLIKPTNQVNRMMPDILALQPQSRALLLYSSLEEFVVSCFGKLPLAETRIRWMAQHLLAGSPLSARLGIPADYPFSLPQSCVFTWFAQIERFAVALDGDAADRLRTLDLEALQTRPVASVAATADWLHLPSRPSTERITAVFQRDAKATQRAYDPATRDVERAAVRARFGNVIQRTLDWARTDIEPNARLPAAWKPL